MGKTTSYLWENAPGKGLTWVEWHAIVFGLLGILAGLHLSISPWTVLAYYVTPFVVVLLSTTVDSCPDTPRLRAVVTEPWYYTASFTILFLATHLVLVIG